MQHHLPPIAVAFGLAVRRLRSKAGLSQEALAANAELSRGMIYYVERGERQPTLMTIVALARALDLRPSELVQEIDKIRPRPSSGTGSTK